MNKKLKIIYPYFGETFIIAQYPIEANTQPKKQAHKIFEYFTTGVKSTNIVSL